MDPDFDFGIGPEIAGPLILLCLALSAFFSASETAITGASRPRLHRLAHTGNRRAVIVNALLDRKDHVISAMLLGNNVVNILAASLSTAMLTDAFGAAGVFYATIAVTVLVVIFSEVLPKTWALLHADRVALVLARPIRFSTALLGPLATAIAAIARYLLRLLRVKAAAHADAADELLRGAIDMHGEGGHEPEAPAEKQMLRSVLDLADLAVSAVMTHRANVKAFDIDMPTDTLVDLVLKSPHTRLPLYRGQVENIVGVIHAKALFRAVHRHDGALAALNLDAFVSEPWFIPETTSLLDQLQAFKLRREHFALVVDEYGALEGVVTLEDIIEEIVGEIDDEHDVRVVGVEPASDGSYVCSGSVPVRDLNREFGWDLPEDLATTIAGLVLHEARRIPDVGQTFAFHGFRFEVLKREGNRIAQLRLVPPTAAAA
ncbi:HlyC/CorC family transporter [Reyranella sp. CPCC 100927]|uniref:HlyC/CorC family transporter n=1 Tax=Reyranella sp. CPCC 100927 TaxID=2599616 RepID=UPI0011B75511|nr:HlyC/CorC family transporter [Reyranella sp. CPCC 100927]TWT08750.1 HlyC/CorC family transporter [Reyranella sp. CPCC 100927]